jgi:hypothetical protein
MSPMQLIDGSVPRATQLESERDMATRRFSELAAAVREHEQALRRSRPLGVRAPDDSLYRRLRQLCGGS